MVNPILVALDTGNFGAARDLAQRLLGKVGGFKVGLEMIMSEGPTAVAAIADLGAPVFADAKLHDIPNTVGQSAFQLARHGARWVSVHASGGGEMISAAATGLEEGSGSRKSGVLAVTVLTSLDRADLVEIGIGTDLDDQVRTLSALASRNGAEGVVCSPQEARVVKDVPGDLLVVTPGVRLSSDDHNDQKRVATPSEAIRNGADLLVIGRAITGADEPAGVLDEITKTLQSESLI